MAQAGMHGLAGVAVSKWAPGRKWLLLGILLGNLLPDADNLAVALAILAGTSQDGLHRTFTHSLFTVVVVILLFWGIARLTGRERWGNLGLGLGIGVLMHILLDLVLWFNGVEILWPLPSWVNLWGGVTPPAWFARLLMPLEMLFFALYFIVLARLARRQGTDLEKVRGLWGWTAVQLILFLIFLILAYTMESGFIIVYGAAYLLSLGLATFLTIRMRVTVEAIASRD